jgi:dihydroorotate dehydrogenase electron transfer subunit
MMQDAGYSNKKLVSGKIVSKTQAAVGHFQMGLLCPHIAHNAKPGQFIQVRVSNSYDPLLPRPLAVYRARGDAFDILFKVVGKGTRLLSEKQIGDTLSIMGPLGKGFPIGDDFQMATLVAGGMGIAALMRLAEAIKDRPFSVLMGASTRDKIVGAEDLLAMGTEVHIATEDGSAGHKGLVSELLAEMLQKEECPREHHRIFACGPTPMLKVISRIAARYNISAYISLEERMACGVGACLGCVCQVISPDGETQYKTVCADGPVFDAREIVWK